ncbi:MAG: alpha/beta hydrolase, partial [Verrucomicrobiota bacterium]
VVSRTYTNKHGETVRLPNSLKGYVDLPYAGTLHPRQRLDLFLPHDPSFKDPMPAIVCIHGGGWRNGHRSDAVQMAVTQALTRRYAGVIVGYRRSTEARWPAQIEDCKMAIRWLKAHAEAFGIDPARIGVFGRSAGGHLASMLGVSGEVKAFEGNPSVHPEQSSRVACVVNHCGPSNLLTLNVYSNFVDPISVESQESGLIGGTVAERPEAAEDASPLYHISPDDRPILHVHGTSDRGVPYLQSITFHQALRQAGVDSTLITIRNGKHQFYYHRRMTAVMNRFFEKHLLGMEHRIKDETFDAAF